MKKTLIVFLLLFLFALGVGVFVFLGKGKSQISDPHLLKIKKEGKIVIGTDATFPPFEFLNENGEIVGFDIDLGTEIAKDLKVNAEFKNIPWDELFFALERGEVDLILAGVTITLERAEKMDFSKPYFNAGQIIVTKKEKLDLIKTPEDVRGKTIGVQRNTTGEEKAKELTDPSLVIGFDDYQKAIEALIEDRVEIVLVDFPTGVELVKKDPNLTLIGEPLTNEFYGVVVKKGEKALLEKVNTTIDRLKTQGILKDLERKWLR